MRVQLYVGGWRGIRRAAGTSARRGRGGRRRRRGRRPAPARSSGAAAAAASTSGPRPATPRAPPRRRRRRPRPASRRRRPHRHRPRRVETPQPGRHRRTWPTLGEGRQHRPALGHPRGGVDRQDLQQRLGPWAARTSRIAAPSRRRRGSSPPTESSSWSAAGGPRPSARSRSARRRPRQRLQPRRQHRAQDPRRGGRPAQPLLDAPAAAAAEQRPEAQPQQGPPRAAGARRAGGRPAAPERARAGCRRSLPAARSRSASSSCGCAWAQRLLLAAGEPQRRSPAGPEAVGDLAGGSAASAPSVPIPSRLSVSTRLPRLALRQPQQPLQGPNRKI